MRSTASARNHVAGRDVGIIQKAIIAQGHITDVNLFINVHLMLKLDARKLFLIDRLIEQDGRFQFGNRVAAFHTPQGKGLRRLADIKLHRGDGIGIFADPGFAVRVDTANGGEAGIRPGRDFIANAHIGANVDIAGPCVGHKRFIHDRVQAFKLLDKESARAVDRRAIECPAGVSIVPREATDQAHAAIIGGAARKPVHRNIGAFRHTKGQDRGGAGHQFEIGPHVFSCPLDVDADFTVAV